MYQVTWCAGVNNECALQPTLGLYSLKVWSRCSSISISMPQWLRLNVYTIRIIIRKLFNHNLDPISLRTETVEYKIRIACCWLPRITWQALSTNPRAGWMSVYSVLHPASFQWLSRSSLTTKAHRKTFGFFSFQVRTIYSFCVIFKKIFHWFLIK